MKPQHAHRLFAAVSQHGRNLVDYLKAFVADGYVPSAGYIHDDGRHLVIGLTPYDVYAIRLDRRQADNLGKHIETVGMAAFINQCVESLAHEPLKLNKPVAMVARSFKHRPSHLQRSRKTHAARIATSKGRKLDEKRAAAYNATCSAPCMIPAGKHRDPKPVTLHTPKPIGLNA